MALPFDLRLFAAGSDLPDGADRPPNARGSLDGARRSRAIHVPSELVVRVRAHDVDAFRELVRLTYVPCVRFAHTLLHSYSSAEDIVQDVFTLVWDRAALWQPNDPAAYLFASVRNHALNELRRRERDARRSLRLVGDSDVSDETGPADPLDRIIGSETDVARMRLVDGVLATFTEHQRTAYDLRYRRGLTVPAIAEVLGITVKGAEQLVSRVTRLMLERLRHTLERSGRP